MDRPSLIVAAIAAALSVICATLTGCAGDDRDTAPRDTPEAIAMLDRVMTRADEIDAAKRHRLDSLKTRVAVAATPPERYHQLEQLFREYRSYSMDTLLQVSRQCIDEARKMGNDSLLYNACIMEAESYKGIGNYAAAISTLEKIPPRWKEVFHRRMLHRYCSIYYSLTEHSSTDEERRENMGKLKAYRDSIIAIAAPRSTDYWLNTASQLLADGNHRGAMALLDSIEADPSALIDPGVLAHTRALGYEAAGDMENAKYHYALAAAHDLSNSVRKYEALQELARILSDEGDNQRAFKYIMRAINDIHASHATSRIQRISQYQPIIVASYIDAERESSRNKNLLLASSAVLLIGLGAAIWYAIRKNRHLNRERHDLTLKNEELQRLRASLSEANDKLKESSKVKEEYLGILFNLSAEYIDSFDKFRTQMSQRLKAGKVKDISSVLAAPIGPDLLQSFFLKFDTIFLDIFPDFIDKFNTLMKPGCEIHPRPGELLSPELRIYALVRLGITDSTKIASFLHYSPQTVYNYRSRVRSCARIPKEEFPRAVKAL